LFNFPASGIFDKIDYRETSPQNCPVFMSREQGQDDSWTVLRLLEWTTGFFKEQIVGPVWVGKLNIAGDAQADLKNHGGVDKAVLAYAATHYPLWEEELGQPLPYGGFGENLTIFGLDENEVCIGDTWKAGDAVFQVSQPRQPCWKMARRWRRSDLPKRVVHTGRSGWYMRILEEGLLTAGDDCELVSRPHPEWSVARANRLFYARSSELAEVAELADLPELSEAWRNELC